MDIATNLAQLLAPLQNTVIFGLVGLPVLWMVLDLITGITSAIVRKTFSAKYLADFLGPNSDMYRYIGMIAAVLATYQVSHNNVLATQATSAATFTAMTISIWASIAENVSEILPISKASALADIAAFEKAMQQQQQSDMQRGKIPYGSTTLTGFSPMTPTISTGNTAPTSLMPAMPMAQPATMRGEIGQGQ